MVEVKDIGVLDQTNMKGAFCECSFSHQACIKSTRILEQAKVETGRIQKKYKGGMGGLLMVCRLAPSWGVDGRALQYRASPWAGH